MGSSLCHIKLLSLEGGAGRSSPPPIPEVRPEAHTPIEGRKGLKLLCSGGTTVSLLASALSFLCTFPDVLSPCASCLGLPVCFQVVQWVAHLSFLHLETFCVTLSPISGPTSGTRRGAFGLHSPFMCPVLAVASGTHLAIQADTLLPPTAPTSSCLNPKLMEHSLLSQVAVSFLNPKSGLRVTVVCVGAV